MMYETFIINENPNVSKQCNKQQQHNADDDDQKKGTVETFQKRIWCAVDNLFHVFWIFCKHAAFEEKKDK